MRHKRPVVPALLPSTLWDPKLVDHKLRKQTRVDMVLVPPHPKGLGQGLALLWNTMAPNSRSRWP